MPISPETIIFISSSSQIEATTEVQPSGMTDKNSLSKTRLLPCNGAPEKIAKPVYKITRSGASPKELIDLPACLHLLAVL